MFESFRRGVYGTEILYLCCQLESRLRPLIFCLRWWADIMGVTKRHAGPWIKNYGMNLMTIFYLQQLKDPVLPPLIQISSLDRIKEINTDASFIGDVRRIDFRTTNTDSVGELLVGFFKYFAQFDFGKNAMCVDQAITVEKVDPSAIDVIDLYGTENAATNVSRKEFHRLKKAIDNTSLIELELDHNRRNETDPWGIVQFFQKCEETSSFKFKKINKATPR